MHGIIINNILRNVAKEFTEQISVSALIRESYSVSRRFIAGREIARVAKRAE